MSLVGTLQPFVILGISVSSAAEVLYLVSGRALRLLAITEELINNQAGAFDSDTVHRLVCGYNAMLYKV